MDCTICNELKEDAPIIELLCGHNFHTECWLRNTVPLNTIGGLRCHECNAYLIPEDLHAEIIAQDYATNVKQDIVKFMWAENEDFKKFLLESMKKWKNHRKSSTILNKKANEILKDEELLEHRQLMKARLAELRKGLMESPEYKEALKNQRINQSSTVKLNTVWGVSGWDVRGALKDEPEVQAFVKGRSWMQRTARVINKFKYYRIR